MPTTWFIVKSDRETGPYTSAQMKHLAQSGQLKADDLVRRDDKLAPVVAGKVQGLFTDASEHPKTTPPPLPSERDKTKPPPLPSEMAKTDTEGSPKVMPLSSRTAGDVLRKTVADLTETTKAAGHLAVAEARKANLTNITLPAAYLALGRDIFAGGRFRSEFQEIYAEIEGVQAEIARLTTGHDAKPGGTFAEKARQTASSVKDTAQAKALGLKMNSLMRRLGQDAYAVSGAGSGGEQIVNAVTECLSAIGKAEDEVHQHTALSQGRVVTPRRMLYGGIGAIVVALIGIVAFFLLSSPQLPLVDSPEVVDLVQKRIRSSDGFKLIEKLSGRTLTSLEIGHPVETKYDPTIPKRMARAKLKMAFGGNEREGDLQFTVEWLNRDKRSIWVGLEDE